jgi:L-rhamnose mutarotase
MKVFATTINLKDDAEIIEKYKEYHRNPFPEVVELLSRSGILDLKIFLRDRRMFMYMATTDDYDPAKKASGDREVDPRVEEWNRLMNSFQEPAPEAGEGEWWASMEQVFDLREHVETNAAN